MKRVFYIVSTIIIFLIEVIIALFGKGFIRESLGDILVVILIYMFTRIFVPNKIKYLALFIFIFSILVELLQLINIVEILGLSNNKFLSTIIGTTFDIKDIISYGVGCFLLFIYEIILYKRGKRYV